MSASPYLMPRLATVIDTQELERRMRPGAWSHEGFLGPVSGWRMSCERIGSG